jgi:DNA polymerase-4
MFVHRAILHLDMDAFFASVEQARRPELRGRPVVVGGPRGGRGVVSACSYEARVFGVHSAMPMYQAERLCPHAEFLPVDMKAYLAVHKGVVALLERYTDLVEVASIDEAYLDVTGSRRLFGPPRAIALRIQEQVYEAHGVTCSIGIGPTKLLAKLAAGMNKPAGIGELTDDDVHGRLRDLPVGDVCGIGPVTQERLAALGLTTVGMLQDVPFPLLAAAFGKGAHARSRSPTTPTNPPCCAPRCSRWQTAPSTTCAARGWRRARWPSRCASTPSTPSAAAARWPTR